MSCCVDQNIQGLLNELTEKNDETGDLQVIRMSINMWTKSLLETITDTREHLHEKLHIETQTTKALIEAT
jgi:hypothetical protein